MAIKFTNFARGLLSVGIGTGDTTITLVAGYGALFPTLSVGDYFYATLENAALQREIVKVTARATDTLTVVRAQDNTTAQAWNAGDSISLRFNAAAITESVANKVSYTLTTGSAVLPKGTTGERDGSPDTGYLRYNTTTNQFEGYGATGWGSIGGGAVANETLLETKHTINSSYTLTTGASALTVGPLSVATGQTLTVPTGEAVVALSTSVVPAADNVTPITTGAQTIYGNKTFTGAVTFTGAAVFTSGLVSTSPTLDIGYDTGAGGTVTQATSRTTAVTLNKPTGSITMFSAAGSTTWSGFLVSNSVVTANDTIVLSLRGGNTNFYTFQVGAVTSGQFQINFVANATATDAPVINFAVIKGATA